MVSFSLFVEYFRAYFMYSGLDVQASETPFSLSKIRYFDPLT